MKTSEIKEAIIEMWLSGNTGVAIALKLNLTRCAVLGHVHRLKKSGLIPVSVGRKADRKKMARPEKIDQTPKKNERPKVNLKENVSIEELKRISCRYIVSGSGVNSTFCGKEIARYSYCEHHAKLCYVPLRK